MAHGEPRVRAVRVCVRLTQIEIDATREQASQNEVHDGDRDSIGRAHRGAFFCHEDLRLRRARHVDDDDRRVASGAHSPRLRHDRTDRHAAAGPLPEVRLKNCV
jgi:hypothetical protein